MPSIRSPLLLSALLSTLLLLSLTLTSSKKHSFSPEEYAALVSVTGCVLTLSAFPKIYLCDFATFSTFPTTVGVSSTVDISSDTACNYIPKGSLSGKIAFAMRGSCPFTQKVLILQEAGAKAVVIGDNEEGTVPSRMKGLGTETEIITIPSIMIGLEDYNSIVEEIKNNNDYEVRISTNMAQDHELADERLKKLFLNSDSDDEEEGDNDRVRSYDPVKLMELGSYMVRSGWKETGTIYILEAGHQAIGSHFFHIQYAIGEFFHNVENNPLLAQPYFEKSIMQCAHVMLDSSTDPSSKKNAVNLAFKIAAIAPERNEQLSFVKYMLEHEKFALLGDIFKNLAEKNSIATGSVMIWADNIEKVGKHELLNSVVNGEWAENHALKESPTWIEQIDIVREVVKEFTKNYDAEKKEEVTVDVEQLSEL